MLFCWYAIWIVGLTSQGTCLVLLPWWRHQMETFFALLAICAGNLQTTGEFPAQRPVMRSFDVFFDLCLNKRLRQQSWGWWFETLSHPLWRHCNAAEHPIHFARLRSLSRFPKSCTVNWQWFHACTSNFRYKDPFRCGCVSDSVRQPQRTL